jgi:tRNA G18 (ribose-2'-O)-methylase SpoU
MGCLVMEFTPNVDDLGGEKKLNVRDDLQSLEVEEIVRIAHQDTHPSAVCCLNLRGDNNLGMIIRTASLLGMSKVFILGRRMYDKRTTVGMHNYITVDRISATTGDHSEKLDVGTILGLLKEWATTYQIIFVEHSGIRLIDLNSVISGNELPPLFILGAEDTGIPDEILEFQPSVRVSIPQVGVGRSYNVSTAFAMVAWEYFRDTL